MQVVPTFARMDSENVNVRPPRDTGLHVPAQSTGAPRAPRPEGLPVTATATSAATGNLNAGSVVLDAVPVHAPASAALPAQGWVRAPPSANAGDAATRAAVAPAMRAHAGRVMTDPSRR